MSPTFLQQVWSPMCIPRNLVRFYGPLSPTCNQQTNINNKTPNQEGNMQTQTDQVKHITNIIKVMMVALNSTYQRSENQLDTATVPSLLDRMISANKKLRQSLQQFRCRKNKGNQETDTIMWWKCVKLTPICSLRFSSDSTLLLHWSLEESEDNSAKKSSTLLLKESKSRNVNHLQRIKSSEMKECHRTKWEALAKRRLLSHSIVKSSAFP